MGLDVAHRQPGGVEPDDLVIHAIDAGLALHHQFRLEAAVVVTGPDGNLIVSGDITAFGAP